MSFDAQSYRERWAAIQTPADVAIWRSFVETEFENIANDVRVARKAQQRLVQLAGGALIALVLNLVLLVVTLSTIRGG
jgi:hypothetical protein